MCSRKRCESIFPTTKNRFIVTGEFMLVIYLGRSLRDLDVESADNKLFLGIKVYPHLFYKINLSHKK